MNMDDNLLCKYFNNQATAEEIEQIEQWLAGDPSRLEEFEAAHMMFNLMALEKVRSVVAAEEDTRRPGFFRRTAGAVLRTGIAAALAVAFGLAGLHFGRKEMLDDITAMVQSVTVPAGDRASLMLPDGTNVFLNGGSRIEYPPVFAGKERRVKLSGEGLFNVVHDASHPFIVETFASEIEVLGTTFNVFTDEEHSRFSTTLAEGKVRVTLMESGDQLTLRPDEMAIFENGQFLKRPADAGNALCWTEGYINVSNVSFGELMSRFERAFDVDILISRPTMPRIGYVSGKIRVSEGVEFALRLLQGASDFQYEIDPATHTIIIK